MGFFQKLLNKDNKNKQSQMSANAVAVKMKKKNHKELSDLHLLQTLGQHVGAVWCVEWSHCGHLLATAGQDGNVLVWAVMGSEYAKEIDTRMGGVMDVEALAIGCPPEGRPILHPVPYAVRDYTIDTLDSLTRYMILLIVHIFQLYSHSQDTRLTSSTYLGLKAISSCQRPSTRQPVYGTCPNPVA